jgi:uncharacterized phage-associated protein
MQTALAHRHNRMHGDSTICIALAHWNNSVWGQYDLYSASSLKQQTHGNSIICIALAHWNNSMHGDGMICIVLAHWNNSPHGVSMIFIALAHWSNSPHVDKASSPTQQYAWRRYDLNSARSLKQQSSCRQRKLTDTTVCMETVRFV